MLPYRVKRRRSRRIAGLSAVPLLLEEQPNPVVPDGREVQPSPVLRDEREIQPSSVVREEREDHPSPVLRRSRRIAGLSCGSGSILVGF